MIKFLGEENIYDDPKNSFGIVVPVPFEFSTSYGQGTSKGPVAILEASQYVELYDEVFDSEMYKQGIMTSKPVKIDDDTAITMKEITDQIGELIDSGKFIVALGGEHSISAAIFSAFNHKYNDLSVLQLDAHADLRDSYEGSKFSHACVMKRIWEINHNIVQCGIRSLSAEESKFIKNENLNMYFAHRLKQEKKWYEAIKHLNQNVYITIDVDFFDPSIMPSTGTPEPGGFLWDEMLQILNMVFSNKNVVGCDVVELSPLDNLLHADFMIARLVYKLFGFKMQSLNKD